MTCDVTVEGSSLGCFFKYSTTTGCTCTSLHSSRARWHLCYWGHPVLPLVCNASEQAAWSCLCCFHSGSICELLNRQIWNNYRNTGRVKIVLAELFSPTPWWLLTHPDARRSLTGFQAQMKTSDSWPRRTMALFWGISTSPSTSIRSAWLSEHRHEWAWLTQSHDLP